MVSLRGVGLGREKLGSESTGAGGGQPGRGGRGKGSLLETQWKSWLVEGSNYCSTIRKSLTMENNRKQIQYSL